MLSSRRLLKSVAVSSAVFGLCACGLLTTFDHVTGSEEPAADSGSVAPTTDAPVENPDSGALEDAASDAPATGSEDASLDAEPSDPCAVSGLTTRICDDFDRTSPLPSPTRAPWGANVGGTTIVIDDVTGSRVLRAFAPATQDGGHLERYMYANKIPITSRAHLEFDLRIVTWPVIWRQTVVMAPDGPIATQKVFFTMLNGSKLAFSDQSTGSPVDHVFQPSPGPGKWSRVVSEIDFVKHKVDIKVNGATVLPMGEVFPALDMFSVTGDLILSVGIRYSYGVSDTTELLFDNVVLATD